MDRQCTGGRIECQEKLKAGLKIWSKDRHRNKINLNGNSQEKMQIISYQRTMLHNKIISTLVVGFIILFLYLGLRHID